MEISSLTNRLGTGPAPSFERRIKKDVNVLSGITKYRVIHVPNQKLRTIHERLKEYLQEIAPDFPHLTGCRPGCSPQGNVIRHRNNRYFYLTDLHKAYWQVDVERLARILEFFDPDLEEVHCQLVEFLKKYCMAGPEGLMTGAPSSPEIFNCYAGVLLDYAIGNYCDFHGMTYTRYLDDIIISSPDGMPIGRHKRKHIRWMIESVDLSISHHKTFVLDLSKAPIVVNGIGLEYGGRIFLPRNHLKATKGMLQQALNGELISHDTLSGRMGTFWSATDRGAVHTRKEAEVLGNWATYKHRSRQVSTPMGR